MAEPLACCLHGIDAAGIRPGSTVCDRRGAIGLMVQPFGLSGAAKVCPQELVELAPQRRPTSAGADLALSTCSGGPVRPSAGGSGKSGADVVD